MSYQYKGNQTYAQEIAAAQAEAEARKAAAAKVREELRALQSAKRKAEEFTAQQRATEEAIFELTNGVKRLPPPIHGGRRGLEAAAAEAHGWWTRKQKALRFELPAPEMNPKTLSEITPKASTIGSDNPREEGVRNGTH